MAQGGLGAAGPPNPSPPPLYPGSITYIRYQTTVRVVAAGSIDEYDQTRLATMSSAFSEIANVPSLQVEHTLLPDDSL